MARLPDVASMGDRPVPVSRRQVATVRNAGIVGQAVANLGEQISAIGERQLEHRDNMEMLQARSAYLADKSNLDEQYSTDRDFATREKRYSADLAKLRDKAATSIGSNLMRQRFIAASADDMVEASIVQRGKVIAGMRDDGRASVTKLLDDNNESLLTSTDALDKSKILSASRAAVANALDAGWFSAEEAGELRRRVDERFATGQLSLMPYDKQVELLKPVHGKQAGDWLGFIPVEKRGALLEQAETKVRAEERSARAEQRLAMQSLVDEAEQVNRLLSDGVEVPPATIDVALANARAAGRDALVYSLSTGKLRSSLNSEYRSATPVELQNEINGLSAEITRLGNKAPPAMVITRDHLMTMRDKAASEVSSDPLSWGAGSLGLAIPPLDWDRPGTLSARMTAARTIAERTQGPVRPLTDEEVKPLQAAIEKGSGGKLAVLDQIRRFGTQGAVAAARQVAPNDDGFRIAAALASLPNSTVAREASRDAVIGADVLASQPQLFDSADASSDFSTFAAPALRGLSPEMQSGVFAAAKNIYAARVSRSGATTWKDDDWPGAVNAALGGYRESNGVRRGGISSYRGQPVLLPDGWAASDFEGVLGRMTDEAVRNSSNGVPVYANGRPVPVNRLKQMIPVAIGDGVYKLSDGTGFVTREQGGPFVINVRKLPR